MHNDTVKGERIRRERTRRERVHGEREYTERGQVDSRKTGIVGSDTKVIYNKLCMHTHLRT